MKPLCAVLVLCATAAFADDAPKNVLALETRWRAEHGDRYWSFPRGECVILPVPNTTTELIAAWFGGRLRDAIEGRGLALPEVVRVEVEENFGQSARHTWRAGGG